MVTAHHHFHQRRLFIIRAHNTCDALGGIKTYSSLSLSKLFYFIHKIIIVLRFPTSQRFHDALRGRWPRRFLIRSEHIPFLIGGTHTGNAAPIAPKAHDHTTIGSRCKKVVQNPAIIFDSFCFDSSSFFCLLCCCEEEEVNLRTRLSLVFFFLRRAVLFFLVKRGCPQKEIYY